MRRSNPLIRWQLWLLGGVTLLLLFRIIAGPPAREGLVVLERMNAESLHYRTFEVDRTVVLSVEGTGSFETEEGAGSPLAAYAWILDAETREPVWKMDESHMERGKRTQAEINDTVRLEAGTYFLYFASFGDHLRGRRNGESHDDAAWKKDSKSWYVVLNLLEGKETDIRRIQLEETPIASFAGERIVWQSGMLEDAEHREYLFKLDRQTPMTIRATGEISDDSHDFASIQNEWTGEEVWRMTAENSGPAGGVEENRKVASEITLDPGVYRVSYQTDATHAYDDWKGNPPFDPTAWGVILTTPDTSEPVAAYDPWDDGRPVISIMPVSNDQYRSVTFRLGQKERVVLYGLGEMRRSDRYDFGWIERVEAGLESEYDEDEVDRYPNEDLSVWEMHYDQSKPAGGDDSNREAMAFVDLMPDVYTLQYRTDGSHSIEDWSNGEPANGERWGVSLFTLNPAGSDNIDILSTMELSDNDEEDAVEEAIESEWTEDRIEEVERAVEQGVDEAIEPSMLNFDPADVLASLNKLGSNADVSKRIELQGWSRLRVIALGEITMRGNQYDYGYIEKVSTGETVWEMTFENTRQAGGDESNRIFDGTIELAAGEYLVHFKTDATHDFSGFNTIPPDMPEAWGITVALAD